jgi:hypothetical protein
MFKLFFRTIIIILFLFFLTIGLAIWKGGEPFRWVGEGTITIGKKISEFGDFVDEMVAGSKKLRKSYEDLKKVVDSEK